MVITVSDLAATSETVAAVSAPSLATDLSEDSTTVFDAKRRFIVVDRSRELKKTYHHTLLQHVPSLEDYEPYVLPYFPIR